MCTNCTLAFLPSGLIFYGSIYSNKCKLPCLLTHFSPIGKTDSTAAMQKAIMSARTHNVTLFVPLGCYVSKRVMIIAFVVDDVILVMVFTSALLYMTPKMCKTWWWCDAYTINLGHHRHTECNGTTQWAVATGGYCWTSWHYQKNRIRTPSSLLFAP